MIINDETPRSRDYAEHNARWVATLDDGTRIIMSPDYDEDGRSSWEQLRDYCSEKNRHIVHMVIHFRDNRIVLPKDKDGYYFCKSIFGGFGMKKNIHYFIVGTLENGLVHAHKYRVPEMLHISEERRLIKDDDPCLIKK